MPHLATHFPAERPAEALAEAGVSLAHLRGLPDLVIGEIAGRDSIAALVAVARMRGPVTILPTVVATGTEHGGEHSADDAVARLRTQAGDTADVLPIVRLASPALWHALNGRFAAELASRYGSWSPCSACHLYVHLCRVPLAWAAGCRTVATGERDAHGDRLKLSQTPETIDASIRAMAHAGIELLEPIRDVDDEATIAGLSGATRSDGVAQPSCVLSGNYVRTDGTIAFDAVRNTAYLTEFFGSAGRAIVDAWRAAGVGMDARAELPDYVSLVAGVLSEPRAGTDAGGSAGTTAR